MPFTLEQVDPSVIYAMLKGEPGTGKSRAALSFPKPIYWFDWDRKMQSLLRPMREWGIDPKSVSYDTYEDWTKARTTLEKFTHTCPYKTLVIDSVTSMADMTLRQTLKLKQGQTRSSGANAGRQIAGIAVNEIEDYNAESSALNELIALTKDIQNYHKLTIVLIAHVMEVQKQVEGKQVMSRTIVTAGKRVAAKVPAYCTEVYHFGIERGFNEDDPGKYMIQTEHTGADFARTALPLPTIIKIGSDPLYSKYMLPAINQLKGEQEKEKQNTPIQTPTPNKNAFGL